MNIELILWIVVGFVIWEIFYIISFKHIDNVGWLGCKIFSLVLTVLFMFIQIGIVFGFNTPMLVFTSPHYIYLVYEAGIIIFLVVFFYLNKKLSEYLEK